MRVRRCSCADLEAQDGVVSAEAERVRDPDEAPVAILERSCGARYVVETELWVWLFVAKRRRRDTRAERQDGRHGFHRAGGPEQVTDRRLRRRHRSNPGVLSESALDRLGLGPIVQ